MVSQHPLSASLPGVCRTLHGQHCPRIDPFLRQVCISELTGIGGWCDCNPLVIGDIVGILRVVRKSAMQVGFVGTTAHYVPSLCFLRYSF